MLASRSSGSLSSSASSLPPISEADFEQQLLFRINQFRSEKEDKELSKRIQRSENDDDPEEIRIKLIAKVKYTKETTDNGGALWEKGHFFPCAMKLINAAKAGRLAEIKRLLRGGHAINARDSEGRVSVAVISSKSFAWLAQ